MYFMKAFACGVELIIMATSPEPWRALLFFLSAAGAGKGKKS